VCHESFMHMAHSYQQGVLLGNRIMCQEPGMAVTGCSPFPYLQVVKPITQPTVKHNFAALLSRTPHSDKDKGKVAQLADLLEKVRELSCWVVLSVICPAPTVHLGKQNRDDIECEICIAHQRVLLSACVCQPLGTVMVWHAVLILLMSSWAKPARVSLMPTWVQMMMLEPERRIDPDTVLRHPFVRSHLPKKDSGHAAKTKK
jgi:hypothetical protein